MEWYPFRRTMETIKRKDLRAAMRLILRVVSDKGSNTVAKRAERRARKGKSMEMGRTKTCLESHGGHHDEYRHQR